MGQCPEIFGDRCTPRLLQTNLLGTTTAAATTTTAAAATTTTTTATANAATATTGHVVETADDPRQLVSRRLVLEAGEVAAA